MICLIIFYDFLLSIIPNFDTFIFSLANKQNSYEYMKIKFDQILTYYNQKQKYNYLKINALLYEILAMLLEDYCHIKSLHIENNQQFIKGSIHYIHEHYQEDISLEMISNHFHVSREHFSRMFKIKMRTTFYQYLIDYRIYRVFPEIVHTDTTIDVIARKHGFLNIKSLTSQFKK